MTLATYQVRYVHYLVELQDSPETWVLLFVLLYLINEQRLGKVKQLIPGHSQRGRARSQSEPAKSKACHPCSHTPALSHGRARSLKGLPSTLAGEPEQGFPVSPALSRARASPGKLQGRKGGEHNRDHWAKLWPEGPATIGMVLNALPRSGETWVHLHF